MRCRSDMIPLNVSVVELQITCFVFAWHPLINIVYSRKNDMRASMVLTVGIPGYMSSQLSIVFFNKSQLLRSRQMSSGSPVTVHGLRYVRQAYFMGIGSFSSAYKAVDVPALYFTHSRVSPQEMGSKLLAFVAFLPLLARVSGSPTVDLAPRQSSTSISPLQCVLQNPTIPVQCCQEVELVNTSHELPIRMMV